MDDDPSTPPKDSHNISTGGQRSFRVDKRRQRSPSRKSTLGHYTIARVTRNRVLDQPGRSGGNDLRMAAGYAAPTPQPSALGSSTDVGRTGHLSSRVAAGTMYRMVPTSSKAARDSGLIAQLRRGALEYCVLAMLERGERYGFDLVRELGEVGGLVTSEGTIYPMLARLRRDGVVQSTWRESPSGPPRRYSRLSPAGRRALQEFREEWVRFRDGVDRVVQTEGRDG